MTARSARTPGSPSRGRRRRGFALFGGARRPGTAAPEADTSETTASGTGTADRRRWPVWARLLAFALVCGLVALAVRVFAIQVFAIPSESMQPTLNPGERIAVWRPGAWQEPERGDLVVVDGRGSFLGGMPPSGPETVASWLGVGPGDVFYVKRVIGVAGDTVECCDEAGRLQVNGQPLDEPYLADPGEPASDVPFAVEVPAGRLWLMGDNRRNSADSRSLLGAPGGGMIPQQRVIGTVVHRVWPDPAPL
ncbi:signal peptidase I [Sediminivirga luteola]|uniref:signal peptidase I n=1 Tax=Sediminivirga luteola TaxID=1774748 RepID=UPI001F5A329B|nr:signal peptidase I [Sediminivirga luteola]MCI2264580.1 signal peptidase I [Sediminivirga luteola]